MQLKQLVWKEKDRLQMREVKLTTIVGKENKT